LRQGDGYNADNRKGSKPQHDRPGRGNAESKQNMSLSGLEVQKVTSHMIISLLPGFPAFAMLLCCQGIEQNLNASTHSLAPL
jgi:hypothetical protein